MENHTKLISLNPVIASSNVVRDIAWYEQNLGFKNVYDSFMYQEGEIDYAVIGKQNLYMHLQFQFPEDMTSTDIKFQVKNIMPLFNELLEKKVISKTNLREVTDWNTTEFGLFDPSGNRITFYEDL